MVFYLRLAGRGRRLACYYKGNRHISLASILEKNSRFPVELKKPPSNVAETLPTPKASGSPAAAELSQLYGKYNISTPPSPPAAPPKTAAFAGMFTQRLSSAAKGDCRHG